MTRGYKKVYALKGGWMEWYLARYPVEKKDAPPPGAEPKGESATVEKDKLPTGKITLRSLYEECPIFKENAEDYQPDITVIRKIRDIKVKTHILLFLGTWCGDSVSEVPKLLKIVEKVDRPRLSIELVAMDRDLKDGLGLKEKYGIERIPTAVFLRDGIEIGRIVERPAGVMESNVLDILSF